MSDSPERKYAARCFYLKMTLGSTPGGHLVNVCTHIVRESSECVGPFLDDTEHINIQCADVLNVPFVRDFTYTVHAVDDCEEWLLGMFDLNNDDDLTYAGDVGAWTGAPVDFTGDNVVDEEDLEALLRAINQLNQ